MLALTTDAEDALGGVAMFTPPVALASDGELPVWFVAGRKNVPDHIRVEFHKPSTLFEGLNGSVVMT